MSLVLLFTLPHKRPIKNYYFVEIKVMAMYARRNIAQCCRYFCILKLCAYPTFDKSIHATALFS